MDLGLLFRCHVHVPACSAVLVSIQVAVSETVNADWPLNFNSFATYAFTRSQNNMDPVLAGITLGTFVKVVELARHIKDSIDKVRKS
jgi:hypothetical protein